MLRGTSPCPPPWRRRSGCCASRRVAPWRSSARERCWRWLLRATGAGSRLASQPCWPGGAAAGAALGLPWWRCVGRWWGHLGVQLRDAMAGYTNASALGVGPPRHQCGWHLHRRCQAWHPVVARALPLTPTAAPPASLSHPWWRRSLLALHHGPRLPQSINQVDTSARHQQGRPVAAPLSALLPVSLAQRLPLTTAEAECHALTGAHTALPPAYPAGSRATSCCACLKPATRQGHSGSWSRTSRPTGSFPVQAA